MQQNKKTRIFARVNNLVTGLIQDKEKPKVASKTTMQLEDYSDQAVALIVQSQKFADEQNFRDVEPIHLLIKALDITVVADVFNKAGCDPVKVKTEAMAVLKKLPVSEEEAYLSQRFLDMLERAKTEFSNDEEETLVGLGHLIVVLSQEKGLVGNVFASFNLNANSFVPYVSILNHPETISFESSFTRDLVALARNGGIDPVVCRDAEIRRVMQILKRRGKSHPLIVGNAGIGKYSLVLALAQRICDNDVPPNLIQARLLEFNLNALSQGVKAKGELESRFNELVLSLKAETRGETILVIRNFDSLLGQGNNNGNAELFKPMFENCDLRFIGTITPEGMQKIKSKDASLLRYVTPVVIEEPEEEQAIEMVRSVASKYERFHFVKIEESAVVSSVRLAKRYLQEHHLPDSAIDLLDETAARKYYEARGIPAEIDDLTRRVKTIRFQESILANNADTFSDKAKRSLTDEMERISPKIAFINKELEVSNIVEEQDVAATLGDWTGIPVTKMLEKETEKLQRMEATLNESVVGQNEALAAVSQAVRRSRLGLRNSRQPIGSFLFLGPSGVGKTELAKSLAKFLFDDEDALIRLDMSEFMERHMAQRLLGSPPGYVDSEKGGFLTEAVRNKPYSILLFDEVEKAHADVFNLLLQLLDDGRLTDGRGTTTDFSNTVVIMTSNIGANKILDLNKGTSNGYEKLREMLLAKVRGFFRPEFLNRIDDIVVFHHLTKEYLRNIVDIQLKELHNLLHDRRLNVELTESAKLELVELGFDPAFGARPLKREIVKNIQNPLAEHLLSGEYSQGDTVLVDMCEGRFIFSKKVGE
jgi:ATP-dependent Clp protease ATP-binding subunit ClpB